MSIGPSSGIVGSIAGTPLTQTSGNEIDRTAQDTAAQNRSQRADERAERACSEREQHGIPTVDAL